MEHLVTGCGNCPMYKDNFDTWYGWETSCNHPLAPEQTLEQNIDLDEKDTPITPIFCPLIIEPIKIKAKFQV